MSYFPTVRLSNALLFDVLCALIVHGIYNSFEVEPANLVATILLLFGIPAVPCYLLTAHIEPLILSIAMSYGLFYAVILSSIALYRLSPLHPLAGYPGPLLLRVSKLVGQYHASNGKQFLYFKSLHDKYGPFVRTGPNEISVADVEAIPPVLGLDGMRKGPLWVVPTKPGTIPSIASLRDVKQHHQRRKLWNHGFTSASVKEFQPVVESRILELAKELGKRAYPNCREKSNSIDLSVWLSNFSYDFMGDMVFGGGFGLMANSDPGNIRAVIESSARAFALLAHAPWISTLAKRLSVRPKERLEFEKFAFNRYRSRKEQGSTKRDLFHYITNEEGLEKMEVSQTQGMNDILIAVIAGADTTSTTLSGLFFYLLTNPSTFDRLREEVDSEFPLAEGEPFDAARLARIPYLNAVINETLRLQPAVPSSMQRSPLEGSGGKFVAGRFVPENTAVYVPSYALHRDPRYFSPCPDSFIPERWLDENRDKFTMNIDAFIPFSTGPANCAGKNLALLELRMVVATIIQKFDVKLAEGYDPGKWHEELKDFMVTNVGKLPVVLCLRQ